MHNGCILCGGVGVGKSHTAVGYYLENEAPRDVIVITTAKKRDKFDWQKIFQEIGMGTHPESTMAALLTVDSWNNISKYKEIKDAFFIFDEQRLVGSGAWVKSFYEIAKNNHWIMLSATPGDTWLDYVPVFRANGFIKNLTQFKDSHVIQRWTGRYYQVHGYRQVGQLVRWRNQILVDMPYEKHTTRHSHDIWVDFDEAAVKELVKNRWNVLENKPIQDAGELFRVMRRVVYSHESRLDQVRALLKKHPRLIVFYNFDFELDILRTLANGSKSTEDGTTSTSSTEAGTPSSSPDSSPYAKMMTGTHPTKKLSHASEKKRSQTSLLLSSKSQSSRSQSDGHPSQNGSEEWLTETTQTRSSSPSSTNPSTPQDQIMRSSTPARQGLIGTVWEDGFCEVCGVCHDSRNCPNEEETCTTNLQKLKETESPDLTHHSSGVDEASASTSGSSCRCSGSSPSIVEESTKTGRAAKSHTQSLSIGTESKATTTGRTSVKPWEGKKFSSLPTEISVKDATPNGQDLCENLPCCRYCPKGPDAGLISSSEDLSSRDFSDSSLRTGSGTGSFTTDGENGSYLTGDADSTAGYQENQETEECQKEHQKSRYLPGPGNHSSSSKPAIDTSLTGIDTGLLTGRPSPTSTSPSSTASKPSSDPSSDGKSSGSTPQFQVAEWNGHKHEEVPTTTSWVYLVQYVAGAEAWECTETDAIVFYSQPYSYKNWHQAHGRIDRLNTSFLDLHYYRLISKAVIDLAVAKSLGLKKSFNEAALAGKMGF